MAPSFMRDLISGFGQIINNLQSKNNYKSNNNTHLNKKITWITPINTPFLLFPSMQFIQSNGGSEKSVFPGC